MVVAYLDSSAIVRQYLTDEPTTGDLVAITGGTRSLATARLSYIEVRAALAAARRASRIEPSEHDRAVASFEADWRAYAVIELTKVMSQRAAMVSETFGLRAGDAIQLASVLALDLEETFFVAWDLRLRLAARAAGVASLPLDA
jgi:predicted nucleic acid-binding protein